MAAMPGKAWAVGVDLGADFLPRAVIEAWDGTKWHLVPAPELDAQRSILYSATAVNDHDVWAAGIQQDRAGTFGTLIEHFDGAKWSVVPAPNPGAFGNQLFGIAADGPDSVHAVGQRDDAHSDTSLVLHWDGSCWREVPVQVPLLARHDASGWHKVTAPDPGSGDTVFGGLSSAGGQVWAVGYAKTDQGRSPLIELHQ